MKYFAVILIFFIVAVPAGAQSLKSVWLPAPVTVDGYPSEWQQPFRYYDSQTKLQYAVANDKENMYLCFKVTDENAQLKIFKAGIDIWIDPSGKKKETMGINFPIGERSGNQADMSIKKLKEQTLLHQTTMEIQGFPGISDQVAPAQNSYGIHAALNWDSLNILCVEYKIPLRLVLSHNLVASDTVKPIGLGFVVNALDAPRKDEEESKTDQTSIDRDLTGRNNMNNNMSGMNNWNDAGIGSMNGNDYNAMTQEQKVWSKLVLSLQ